MAHGYFIYQETELRMQPVTDLMITRHHGIWIFHLPRDRDLEQYITGLVIIQNNNNIAGFVRFIIAFQTTVKSISYVYTNSISSNCLCSAI